MIYEWNRANAKREELTEKLNTELRAAFNNEGLAVISSTTKDNNGNPAFDFAIIDQKDLNAPDQEIVDYAQAIVKAYAPKYTSSVKAAPMSQAL